MAHITTIPIELTQRIMKQALAALIADTDAPPLPLPHEPPLLFTQVSTAWRDISLNMPELWAAIKIDDSVPTAPPQIITQWCTRAGVLPLTIELENNGRTDPQRSQQLLAASMAFCHRWEDIHLRIPFGTFQALVEYNGSYPLLRTLLLSMTSNVWEGEKIIPMDAPLLRNLTLLESPDLTVDGAWSQLTKLHLNVNDDLVGVTTTLQSCINLEELHFALMMHHEFSSSIPPFELPALRSLVTAGRTILPCITAPNLVRLDIWGPGFGGEMEDLLVDLRAMVARSACSLNRFSFRIPPNITTVQLQNLLEVVPAVTDLRMTFHFVGLLAKFETVLQAKNVLSKLRTLRVLYGPKAEESYQPLLNVLNSRLQNVEGRAKLEEFHMDTHRPVVLPLDVKNEMLALGNQGLRVEFEVKLIG
ncbi:F-box domain-containing protein [Favolaschia claudopus]|uniref:F-box domain-containing protein n=1 Tax=Favolaschia claudopus TaxID=2862362 RepID=A0AAW0EKP7_9AGAR